MKKKLILGSSSARRLELLKSIGYHPDIVQSPDIDETPYKKEKARSLVLRLAVSKAEAVVEQHDDSVVISADTIANVRSKILGKPKDADQAREFLRMISGKRHKIYTGICVLSSDGSKALTRVSETIVKFKLITKEEEELFIASEQWKGAAGGYKIQGLIASCILMINGSYSNVMGLPLYEANNLLRAHGMKPVHKKYTKTHQE